MAVWKFYALGALTLGLCGIVWSAGPSIGTAAANGAFAVNGARVSGTVPLFDGALVETASAASRVELNDGSRVELNAYSAVALRAAEADLLRGSGRIGPAAGFAVRARSLRIEPQGGQAEVRLSGDHSVYVAAGSAPVRVRNESGIAVAVVAPLMAMTFDPYAAPPDDFDVTGCLLKQASGSRFGLAADDVRFEVAGQLDLSSKGNRVHVVGRRAADPPALKGASVLVHVSRLETVAGGGCSAAAASWPGETMDGNAASPTAAKAVHHSRAPLIVGGVSVAAAGAGAAVALTGKSR